MNIAHTGNDIINADALTSTLEDLREAGFHARFGVLGPVYGWRVIGHGTQIDCTSMQELRNCLSLSETV